MKFNNKLFISFEGPEASGKSSQIILLKKFFIKNNIPFVITREPGGTNIAEKLRKIILTKSYNISTLEEILLLMAARYNHINNIIKPALKSGKIVITDRFADSTFVYQGFVSGFGIDKIKKLHKNLLNNFLPDKTFLFELKTNEIISRLINRNKKNKYDKINKKFHNRVILGYKKISNNNKRFIKVDGNKNINEIHNFIIKKLI